MREYKDGIYSCSKCKYRRDNGEYFPVCLVCLEAEYAALPPTDLQRIRKICEENKIKLIDCGEYDKWKVPKKRIVSWFWIENQMKKDK